MRCRTAALWRPEEGQPDDHAGLSPTLLRLLREEPLRRLTILDVGCGSGRLTFAIASEAARIIGIDRSSEAIERASRKAAALELPHVAFRCLDAETVDYHDLGPPDLVAANLCMSDEILRRAGAALAPGRAIVFAAFHHDQWKESGKVSRDAYTEARVEGALEAAGFAPVYLGLEQAVVAFAGPDDAMAYVEAAGLSDRWKADSRWEGFRRYLQDGGRELTARARVIVKARRR
jgi:SAM-dependent methyltransferase